MWLDRGRRENISYLNITGKGSAAWKYVFKGLVIDARVEITLTNQYYLLH